MISQQSVWCHNTSNHVIDRKAIYIYIYIYRQAKHVRERYFKTYQKKGILVSIWAVDKTSYAQN